MSWEFDYLIVGAGLAGLILAERLSTQRGARCLVVEKRAHIGGNCFDAYDSNGVLIHKYGPHYFRTNSARIREYLSQFTEWLPVDYRIKSYTSGRYWSFPINLQTYEEMIGRAASEAEFAQYLASVRVDCPSPKNSEEVITSQVGDELYNLFFKGYTLKQWKRHPRDLDTSVCGRIPIRTHRDDRYFNDSFQALPSEGYTRMFERMLRKSGDVRLLLRTDYREVVESVRWRKMIYTGPIDEFYRNQFGPLPYRSLRFEEEHFTADQLAQLSPDGVPVGFWQPALQVNYPNDREYTRIVEIKHATHQACTGTTIVREYPEDYGEGREPYYPVPAPAASALYARYAELAARETKVHFVGRLATYRYYNMDQVVDAALAKYQQLSQEALGS